jgi:hypothetical protein
VDAVRNMQDSNPHNKWKAIDTGSRVYRIISDVMSRTRDAIILYFVLQKNKGRVTDYIWLIYEPPQKSR